MLEKNAKLGASSNIRVIKSRKMRRPCSMHGKMRNICKIFVRKPEGKRSFGRLGIGWKAEDWIHLVQDRDQWQALVNMVPGEFGC
jgi:hypothetical protein